LIARLDPRWKLVAMGAAAVAVSFLRTIPALSVALLGVVLIILAARVPAHWLFRRLAAVAPFLVFMVALLPFVVGGKESGWRLGWLVVSPDGVRAAVAIALKASALIGLSLVVLATTPLHVMLQAERQLGLPGIVTQITILAQRYLFLLSSELKRLRIALRVRGHRNRATLRSYRTLGQVAGTLLVRSSERAERVGQAMRCRGFDGTFRSLTAFRTTAVDVGVFMLVFACSMALIAYEFLAR
jgi:cobalt/nickel transport system permease protein